MMVHGSPHRVDTLWISHHYLNVVLFGVRSRMGKLVYESTLVQVESFQLVPNQFLRTRLLHVK